MLLIMHQIPFKIITKMAEAKLMSVCGLNCNFEI